MAFSDYKHISQVQQQFLITYQEERFLAADELAPPAQFLEEFAFNQQHLDIYASEGSRSELIILPLLRESYKPYAQEYELDVIGNKKTGSTPQRSLAMLHSDVV